MNQPASPTALPGRWWVLTFASLALFGNYYVYDSIAPVADLLTRQLNFSDTQLGSLNAVYSLPNIFLVLAGGLLIDRFGAARITTWTAWVCLSGALLTAALPNYPTMLVGRLLFGIGAETMIVGVTAGLGQWFRGSSMALALGLNLSLARAGSYAADVSPSFAKSLYQGWQAPLLLAALIAASAVLAAHTYLVFDKRRKSQLGQPASERLVWRDVLHFGKPFWYLLALCVLFYAAVLPFRSTFAIKFFQHARSLSLEDASLMNSWVYFAAIFASPAFGFLYDRIGRRTLFLAIGAFALPASFLVLGATTWNLWVATVGIGIAFSLVPAVLWPSVCQLVEEKRLGTALGLMTMLQNIGLAAANLAAGWLNDRAQAGPENPQGYLPMLMFFGLMSSLALLFVLLLHFSASKPNHPA